MYFPFLRGKQFELIALREISPKINGQNNIRPIIEPIKQKTATYTKTLDSLTQNNINFTIIINPSVGNLLQDIDYICAELLPHTSYENYQLGILLNSKTDLNTISKKLKSFTLEKQSIIVILDPSYNNESNELNMFIDSHSIKYIAIDSNSGRRSLIRKLRSKNIELISISDPYNKLSRNKDYASEPDEFFSEEHIYFKDENYKGFSDYLTVGNQYSSSGFSPYAVAIHLTYHDEDRSFRIHHFVSNSNDDIYDVGGKFLEALDKLIPFINTKALDTDACNQFRQLHTDEKYPGLGTVKKLSILHHLELINDYLSQ